MENTAQPHELIRQKLWCDIAIAYVNSSNSTSKHDCARWADKVLSDFDDRFKEQKGLKNA